MLPIPQSQTTHHCKPTIIQNSFSFSLFHDCKHPSQNLQINQLGLFDMPQKWRTNERICNFQHFPSFVQQKVQINCLRSYFVSDTKHTPFGDMAIPRIHNLLVLLFCQQSIFWCYRIVEVPHCTKDLLRTYYNSPIRVSAPLIRLPFRI